MFRVWPVYLSCLCTTCALHNNCHGSPWHLTFICIQSGWFSLGAFIIVHSVMHDTGEPELRNRFARSFGQRLVYRVSNKWKLPKIKSFGGAKNDWDEEHKIKNKTKKEKLGVRINNQHAAAANRTHTNINKQINIEPEASNSNLRSRHWQPF